MTDTHITNESLIQEIRRTGDPSGELKLALWRRNRGLVQKAVAMYDGRIESDDARQECFLAFLEAVDDYDAAAGAFTTILFNRCKWRLYAYCGQCSAVSISAAARGEIIKYKDIVRQYYQLAGRAPTDQEACAVLGISPAQLDRIKAGVAAENVSYLDAPTDDGEGGETDLYDIVPNESIDVAGAVVDGIHESEQRAAVREALGTLEAGERAAVVLHVMNELTYQQAADRTGTTAAAIRGDTAKGLRHLRTGKARRILEGYLPRGGIYSMGIRGGLSSFKSTWTSSTEFTALKDLGALQDP